jgi:hypothetical protein
MQSAKWGIMAGLVLFLTVGTAGATIIDVQDVFANAGFEQGTLSGWNVMLPSTVYATSMSLDPSIDPADPTHSTATLSAPSGAYFTGLSDPGTTANYDFKLVYNAVPINVATGTVFLVTVYANRGDLEPNSAPVSTANLQVNVFGWTSGAQPTPILTLGDNWSRTINWINPAYKSVNFTGVADGSWTSETFTFDPNTSGKDASTIKYLSMSIVGVTHSNQYVAVDMVPEPASLGLLALAGLAAPRKRRK